MLRASVYSNVARDWPELGSYIPVQINEYLVDITPTPTFGRVISFYDGVAARVEMFAGMEARGLLAAANVATGAADSQVHPMAACLQALFAASGAWMHLSNRRCMRTSSHWHQAAFLVASN
jgi:hypothetical protein